jgi:D-glycero-alpha-D-manno-heptose-7-phosphate kinase
MLIRSKAPLRLGLAGGGSDVSPYSDIYGGAILNATISMYAYTTIEPRDDGKVILNALDKGERYEMPAVSVLEMDGNLDLIKGIYNRVVKDFTGKPLSFELSTYVDAPPGSGLGSSSTLVIAILGAFSEWLNIPMGEYDMAHLAYQIERIDMNMSGGKQDQYAAAFGGVNFMEFYANDKVIVNPLRIKIQVMQELAHSLVLYYTETSRTSSQIIETQKKNVLDKNMNSVEAMHNIKEQALLMKEALLKGELNQIGEIMDFGWRNKKKMAEGISNPWIDKVYEAALKSGATGGKVSGAGGGGFMFFYCPGNSRHKVIKTLESFGGQVKRYEFTDRGLNSWII